MSTVSRGFRGRRRPSVELPPRQYLVEDFPVLSAGPTPASACRTGSSSSPARPTSSGAGTGMASATASPSSPRTGPRRCGRPSRGPSTRRRGGQQLLDQAASRTSRPYFCPPLWRRSPPRRAAGTAGGVLRACRASSAGPWRKRGQPGANQTWRIVCTCERGRRHRPIHPFMTDWLTGCFGRFSVT